MKAATLCVGILTVALVGCSSTNSVKIADGSRKAEQYKVDKIEFPEWYVTLPKEDNAIYASATEVSSDLQFSVDKALMAAKRDIAFKLSNDFNQKYKEHATETNYTEGDKLSKETERLTIINSTQVNLVGVQRVKTEIIREGNRYRSFVLVRYGLDESNRIHMNYMAKERKANAKKEMDKFDQELKEQRKENTSSTKPDMLGPRISNPEVRAQVLELYKNPDAVVMKGTIQ